MSHKLVVGKTFYFAELLGVQKPLGSPRALEAFAGGKRYDSGPKGIDSGFYFCFTVRRAKFLGKQERELPPLTVEHSGQ